MSKFIGLGCGIRQGGVLSPYFFALYIDNVVKKINDIVNSAAIWSGSVPVFYYCMLMTFC